MFCCLGWRLVRLAAHPLSLSSILNSPQFSSEPARWGGGPKRGQAASGTPPRPSCVSLVAMGGARARRGRATPPSRGNQPPADERAARLQRAVERVAALDDSFLVQTWTIVQKRGSRIVETAGQPHALSAAAVSSEVKPASKCRTGEAARCGRGRTTQQGQSHAQPAAWCDLLLAQIRASGASAGGGNVRPKSAF